MFQPVDPKKSLPTIEKEQLEHWQREKIFEQSTEARKNEKKFVFFDGPPFANGLPHYGHILASALKDAVTRYWNMKGYFVPRTNGWDCHGLPVEYEIEKELEVSGHKQIEELGVDVFNNKCRESVFRYTGQWEEMLKRIGRWVDFEDGYATLDNDYMESIWHVFGQIWEKELVYKGYKSMHICPRCETPLSNFEVTQGYKDVTDFSVTAKFKVKDEDNTFILAWTTTPWTLPGNQALAVGLDIEYAKVKKDGENLILAKELLESVFGEEEVEIVEELEAKDIVGKKYEPLFPYYKDEGAFEVYTADFVTTESGTGIVHIAGGYGEDDYNLVKENKQEPIQHVGIDGNFKPEVTEFAGKFVKGQDQNIADYLKEKGTLFKGENYRHSYPHCWRCDTPLLNYSLEAWFIEVTKIQDKLIANNKKIHWQPEHIREGRFGKWLENVKDWNVSRNRFWGCPIPVWESESGKKLCVSSVRDLRKYSTNGNNLFFVRHGQADHNVLGIMSADIHTKRNLTEEGVKQAQVLRDKLKDKNISVIYCSPFHRTTETARIINQELGVEVIFDERLREKMTGELEGAKFEKRAEVMAASDDPYNLNLGNSGESYQDLENRMLDFINSLSGKHENENIVVVTHGGCLATMKRYFEDLPKDMATLDIAPYIDHESIMEIYSGKLPMNDGKLDLHKPYIDNIVLKDEEGETYNRIGEVFDCWFESGSMPYAQLHYPFENKEDFEKNFPADFIAEGLDQTRGWFYTLHVLSTILFDKPAFNNVIVNGILLAKNGEKLSKRKKNYPDPNELFNKKGVDSTRLFMYQSTAPLAEDVRFSEDHVDEIVKKFTLTLWNTYSFFVTYGNIDKFDPNEQGKLKVNKLHELDRWIISEVNQLIDEVTEHMDDYNLTKATRPLIDFVDNLSNWYIRRSRRRFWKSENDKDKMQAYQTLHYVLITLCKLIAPFTPFIADEIYRNLTGESSVHLCNWPESDKKVIDHDLNEKMYTTRMVVGLGHAIRGKENIKVRQPLQKIQVAVPNSKQVKYIKELEDVILEELNIKSIEILDNPEDVVTQSLKPDAKALGPELGQEMKQVINDAREGKYKIKGNKVEISGHELDLSNFEVRFEAKEGFSAESDQGIVVILDTTITEELKQEGWARDIVRTIQDMRKEANYNVSDRIYLYVNSESSEVDDAVTNYADYIREETLSIELQQSDDFEWDLEKEVEIDSNKVTIAIRR